MRIKLDENIPASLAEEFSRRGHDVDTVPGERLTGAPDSIVWEAVRKNQRLFITQDLDFSDIRRFQPGDHAGLLLVRLKMPGRTALIRRIREVFDRMRIDDLARCFAVLTQSKLRVIQPSKKQ